MNMNGSADYEAIHQRWMSFRNRKQENPEYEEGWWSQQCLHCRHFIPLIGIIGEDYGVCANSVSKFDAQVRFEHDGCEHFSPE